MATTWSSYYNLVRTRESSPEVRDWAATDKNVEVMSTIMKSFEQHTHTGNITLTAPGTAPTLTPVNTGGVLTPGTTVGVRLSFSNAMGLETEATKEVDITLAPGAERPLSPSDSSISTYASGLGGGVYTYVLTKTSGSGETNPSDALAVNVPYDQAYSVTLTFDPISSYTDGTSGYNIYRSAGLNSTFQLVGQIADSSITTFVDYNVAVDPTVQPPSVSTFNQTRQVLIQWVGMTYPTDATRLNVYVTQQTGTWSTDHLLTSVDTTGGDVLDYIYYQGSETLASGTPYEGSQVPNAPQKINLGSETTGGFVLTTDGDFVGHQAKNMKLHVTTSPTVADGVIYYDSSIPTVRARINGAWVNWGTSTASAYVHPVEEDGGHAAANIRWKAGSASPNLHSVLGTFFNNDGDPIQATIVEKAIGDSANPVRDDTDGSYNTIDDMSVSITPQFDNQWVEIVFEGSFGNKKAGTGTASFIIKIDGSEVPQTRRYLKLTQNDYGSVSINHLEQLSAAAHTIEACWNVTFKPMKVVSLGKNRCLTAKTIL